MRSFSQAQDNQALATGFSPYHGPEPHIRDALEADRLAWRKQPDSAYPSGYLGTITGRRQDRLSEALWRNQKSYTRGVHRGERVPMDRYFWPQEFHLGSGVQNQYDTDLKFVPAGYESEPKMLTNDGKPGPSLNPNGTPAEINPDRAAQLSRFRPPWRAAPLGRD